MVLHNFVRSTAELGFKISILQFLGTSMHSSEHPANKDELIVNKKVFGKCNHDFWSGFNDKHNRRLLVCDDCKEEFEYRNRDDQFGDDTPNLKPADFLKSTIQKYSQDDILANLTLNTIEMKGWTSFIKNDGQSFICVLTRANNRFSSEKNETRAAAICEVAAKLGASGLLT